MTAAPSTAESLSSSVSQPLLSPIPPPVPVETHPNRGALKRPIVGRYDLKHLSPEDVRESSSPSRPRPPTGIGSPLISDLDGTIPSSSAAIAAAAAAAALRPAVASLRPPPAIPTSARLRHESKRRSASRKRRQPGGWKKLLWIRQPYPDNFTDTETFLDHLQRNPKLRPYDFWPLVADSTVIVQHVCSVVIFVCCFAGIYQDRISPVSVVGVASLATVTGWSLWDYWMGKEEEEAAQQILEASRKESGRGRTESSISGSELSFNPSSVSGHAANPRHSMSHGLGLTLSTSNLDRNGHDRGIAKSGSKHKHSVSANSLQSLSPISPLQEPSSEAFPSLELSSSRQSRQSQLSNIPYSFAAHLVPSYSTRVQSRLKTIKSALLINFTLLGLSPILKSLTRSTSSDSIWALATWLLIINIFFFDYGAVYTTSRPPPLLSSLDQAPLPGRDTAANTPVTTMTPGGGSGPIPPPFPSILSTNAALMASTVLASRLPSTNHVFSLTVFSIEVFGLFPVFRRHVRHISWMGHVLLTMFLVLASSTGMSIILSTSYTHTYGDCRFCWGWIWHILARSVLGILIGGTGTGLVMGGCSWWLISLQRYKNVVIGPWDPARPVLAGGALLKGRTSSG